MYHTQQIDPRCLASSARVARRTIRAYGKVGGALGSPQPSWGPGPLVPAEGCPWNPGSVSGVGSRLQPRGPHHALRLPHSVHLQLHGGRPRLWLPGGPLQQEGDSQLWHLLLVRGHLLQLLHPPAGESCRASFLASPQSCCTPLPPGPPPLIDCPRPDWGGSLCWSPRCLSSKRSGLRGLGYFCKQVMQTGTAFPVLAGAGGPGALRGLLFPSCL